MLLFLFFKYTVLPNDNTDYVHGYVHKIHNTPSIVQCEMIVKLSINVHSAIYL